MKKKICMIVPSFSAKGGITAVVNGYRGSKLEQQYDVKYIETYCDGNKLRKLCKAVLAYFRFLRLVLFWHPNIVHLHSSFDASFYRKLPYIVIASACCIPVVNHIHGSYYEEFFFDAREKKRKLVTSVYQKCNIIIALSEEAKKALSEIAPGVNIIINENCGQVHEAAYSLRSQNPSKHMVLFLGFISEKKGCFDIPAIIEIVQEAIPDVQFVLGGSGDIDAVRELASQKAKEHMIFPGWVRGWEKDTFLSQADVFFLPSYSEAMPMSVLEAMGYGLPVVASNVGGIPHIVHHGQNGYIYAPGDKHGMASAIVELLKNNDLRAQMGRESMRTIYEGYSIGSHIDKLVAIYEGLGV